MVSPDGFFKGENHELEWHHVDDEFNKFAGDQLNSRDILLFGRSTYELMASYWLTSYAMAHDPIIAEKMNSMSKIVFSKTLKTRTGITPG